MKDFDKLQPPRKKIAKNVKKDSGISGLRKDTDELKKSQTELDKIQKTIVATKEKLIAANSKEAQQLANLRVQQQEQNKVLKQNAKESLGLVNAYDRLTKELREAQLAYKNMAASGRASTKELHAQQQVVQGLDSRVKKIDASVGQFQRNVGNYPRLLGSASGALKNFAAAFGLIGGIQLFANVLRNTFQRIRDFDKELVNLAAVAGKTEVISVVVVKMALATSVRSMPFRRIMVASSSRVAARTDSRSVCSTVVAPRTPRQIMGLPRK